MGGARRGAEEPWRFACRCDLCARFLFLWFGVDGMTLLHAGVTLECRCGMFRIADLKLRIGGLKLRTGRSKLQIVSKDLLNVLSKCRKSRVTQCMTIR